MWHDNELDLVFNIQGNAEGASEHWRILERSIPASAYENSETPLLQGQIVALTSCQNVAGSRFEPMWFIVTIDEGLVNGQRQFDADIRSNVSYAPEWWDLYCDNYTIGNLLDHLSDCIDDENEQIYSELVVIDAINSGFTPDALTSEKQRSTDGRKR
jgi:hypothetical protein